jgi:hypothetical protein
VLPCRFRYAERSKREKALFAGCSVGWEVPTLVLPIVNSLYGAAGVVSLCSAAIANALAGAFSDAPHLYLPSELLHPTTREPIYCKLLPTAVATCMKLRRVLCKQLSYFGIKLVPHSAPGLHDGCNTLAIRRLTDHTARV